MKKYLPLIWSLLTRTRPMWGMIPLRIIFGALLMLHGVAYMGDGYFSVVGILEIIAGGASIAGFMVRLVGLFVALEMIVAQFVPAFSLGFSTDVHTQFLVVGIVALMIFSGGGAAAAGSAEFASDMAFSAGYGASPRPLEISCQAHICTCSFVWRS